MTAGGPAPRPPHFRVHALMAVFLGGLIGTGLRYGTHQMFPVAPDRWPWATLAVNVIGAFVLGALLELLARSGPDEGRRQRVRLFGGTGLCGALTTYSTVALEITELARASAVATAVAYAVVSVVLGLLAAGGGIALASRSTTRWAAR